ncbi:type I phosphomannose isomerase catalytic subunit [Mycoplasma sp. SG1]|uniref:type I phosphomannose isomerase catalytic subunit n=1 Tax=Mycoplasma sp. SG1 TaxID=2810348 RepID=UPI00202439D5|nr:type I phosphomannose isomerase catalytic subunit [Mycoplasma sp. SG1]URM53089.1 class I mannose-6-phosphate isomerase [Mycoplasma sp. SG1]
MLFLNPIFIEKLWGGEKFKKYNFSLPNNSIGEVIVCGAIAEEADSKIERGVFQDLNLSFVWKVFPNLFNNFPSNNFPLLIKLISAEQDLSIQVHPTEEYAKLHDTDPKTEAWFILESSNDNKIIYGHQAKDKDELTQLIKNKNWIDLINEIRIDKNDCLLLVPGTVHAIKAGTVLYELQQPSLETYRLYDYDRLDKNKQLRALHIDQALDNIYYPQLFQHPDKPILEIDTMPLKIWKLFESIYFIAKKVQLNSKKDIKIDSFSDYFLVLTMISGQITFNDHLLTKGVSLILTKDEIDNFYVFGNGEFILAAPISKIS